MIGGDGQDSPMFKRILLPLDGSVYCEVAMKRACEIALAHGAEITGLVVLNTPELLDEERLPFNAQLLSLQRKGYFMRKAQEQSHIDGILQRFRNCCEGHDVRHREASLQGMPAQCILEESVYYDLIVMGMETYFHLDPEEKGDSMELVLDQTVVPIFAVTNDPEIEPLRHVLIAFNGSFHSARALREFAEFSEPYSLQITLLMADKHEEHAEHCLHEALVYLEANGIREVNQIYTDKEIIKAIDEDYLHQVDLVVAGMHSKNIFKNFFVGSLVKHMIKVGKVPLFLG